MVDNKQQWKAWLYLAPAIILLIVFTFWPIINTVRVAFLEDYGVMDEIGQKLEYDGVAYYDVGLKNFQAVIGDGSKFFQCLKITTILCVATVPLSTILALLVAVALNSIKPLRKTLQTIYFLPYVTNSIAIGMVFTAMFSIVDLRADGTAQSYGIINNLLMFLGGEDAWINWMAAGSTEAANIAVLVIYIVWNALPFKILVLLGGLQSINTQYYDAAKVDSTPRRRVFTRITVPLLSPMIAYVVITGFIGGFKEYSSVVGIFGEEMGPRGRLTTVVGMVYEALGSDDTGEASAAALILFGIILIVTLINNQVSKKSVHY